LQAFAARIRLVGLASKGKSVSVVWDLLSRATIRRYAGILASEAVTKEFHNASYDMAVSRNPIYRFLLKGPIECTLLGQHAAWPGAKKDLQATACQMLAIPPWKAEHRDKGDSLEEEAEYNAKDALATWATVPINRFWIKKYDAGRVYDVDRVKAHVATEMHLRGYMVDYEVNAEIKKRLQAVIDEAKALMMGRYEENRERVHARLASEQAKGERKADLADGRDYAKRMEARLAELNTKIEKGKWVFDPSNDNHAVAFLKAMGVKLWRTTKTGKTASGGSVLEEFGHVPEVAELSLLRSNEQLLETFIIRMFEWVPDGDKKDKWRAPHVQDDGRCHPIWSGTQMSGRYGSRTPASSNWSIGDETHLDPRKRLPNTRRQLVAAPSKIIVAFDYCLVPGTRILRADLSWVPIETLRVGDTVVGFDEDLQNTGRNGRGAKYRRSTVECVQRFTRPVYRIITDKVTVTASAEHQWVARKPKHRRKWVATQDLQAGDLIGYFAEPWEPDTSWMGGFIAGFLEGEGWVNTSAGFGQKEGPALDRVLSYLHGNGFQFCTSIDPKTQVHKCVAKGTFGGCRFLGTYRAPRLLARGHELWEDRSTWGRKSQPARVLAVEYVGEREVVAIRTSTRTFVAEGLLSHNCQLEARLIAVQSGDEFLCKVFAEDRDIHHEFGVMVFPEMARLQRADPKGFADNPQYQFRRDLTKRFEYGGIYGGADMTVWKSVVVDEPSITLKMVSTAIATMKQAIVGVTRWQQRLLRETSLPPYTLKSYLLGRRRVFPLGNPPPTDINNNPNQFAGADIIDMGLCRMMPRLEKYNGTAYPILHQHDAMYFECNEADGPRVARDVAEAFPTTVRAVNGQEIDFPVEIKMGYAYHSEPKPSMIEKFPWLVWDVGRPGLKKWKA
jgi:DNA polymerase I-like protein with 3'-5' exonuclease and polymerase domains